MIAPAEIPRAYQQWNKRNHAPFGRSWPLGKRLSERRFARKFRGPFSIQPNSLARRFEYPWAHEQITELPKGSVIVEIGGGLSGFQFVLAREGYRVTNVDPGMAAKGLGWPAEVEQHRSLSGLFGGPVTLIPTVLEEANIASDSVDGIVCISTVEHLTSEDIAGVTREIRRILKPGGLLVLTVDLFLDIQPFASEARNKWGANVDIKSFLECAGLELTSGDRSQLVGYPEFDGQAILGRRGDFIADSSGVALAQCLTASRPLP
jgi:SAM-dependent methyltransferase